MQLFLVMISLLVLVVPASAQSVSNAPASQNSTNCEIVQSSSQDYRLKIKAAQSIVGAGSPEFSQCQTHEDCVVALGVCGEFVSVTVKAKECFDRAAQIYGSVIDCIRPESIETPTAQCVDNTCRIISAGEAAE